MSGMKDFFGTLQKCKPDISCYISRYSPLEVVSCPSERLFATTKHPPASQGSKVCSVEVYSIFQCRPASLFHSILSLSSQKRFIVALGVSVRFLLLTPWAAANDGMIPWQFFSTHHNSVPSPYSTGFWASLSKCVWLWEVCFLLDVYGKE